MIFLAMLWDKVVLVIFWLGVTMVQGYIDIYAYTVHLCLLVDMDAFVCVYISK